MIGAQRVFILAWMSRSAHRCFSRCLSHLTLSKISMSTSSTSGTAAADQVAPKAKLVPGARRVAAIKSDRVAAEAASASSKSSSASSKSASAPSKSTGVAEKFAGGSKKSAGVSNESTGALSKSDSAPSDEDLSESDEALFSEYATMSEEELNKKMVCNLQICSSEVACSL